MVDIHNVMYNATYNVMHNGMHTVMKNVMHNVMNNVIHNVMCNVLMIGLAIVSFGSPKAVATFANKIKHISAFYICLHCL